MAGRFNPEEYETVAERLSRFKEAHPNYRMVSDLVDIHRSESGSAATWVLKVTLWKDADDEHPVATGYAEETDGTRGASESAALENAETSALGRALANAGFSGNRRVTREEMRKTNEYQSLKTRIEKAATREELQEVWQDAVHSSVKDKITPIFTKRAKEIPRE